jgi:hypothetical protein
VKSSQTRAWTSFIEAVTAIGRPLIPGIIFKGKYLQAQWFLDKFKHTANWYLITSHNGWTNNHIAYSWLTDVYDPQKKPNDPSDTRLIIMDGHGSHATDEWMFFCFLNNIYCCYFPAHCSHEMQPLNNGPFNAVKAAYRKKLKTHSFNNDSRLIDKINFVKTYSKAREAGLTEKNIQAAFRTTGNWPISRRKALSHPEIQLEHGNATPEREMTPETGYDLEATSKNSRQIWDYGKGKSPTTRRYYNTIAKGYEVLEFELANKNDKIAALEAEVARLTKTRKRRAVPNPNKKSMLVGEAIVAGQPNAENGDPINEPVVDEEGEEPGIDDDDDENEDEIEALITYTRSLCAIKNPRN